jgi:hypothetical protein
MIYAAIDIGALLAVAIGLLLGASGSLWFINRAVAGDHVSLDPAVKRRIEKALIGGSAVTDPTEAGIAAEVAAARRASLKAARGALLAYLVMAAAALLIAVAIGDALVIVMALIIFLLTITGSVGSTLLAKRLSKAEIANRALAGGTR